MVAAAAEAKRGAAEGYDSGLKAPSATRVAGSVPPKMMTPTRPMASPAFSRSTVGWPGEAVWSMPLGSAPGARPSRQIAWAKAARADGASTSLANRKISS